MKTLLCLCIAGCVVVLCVGRAVGQEAMYTAAATMPPPGSVVFRPQLMFSRYGADPDGPSTRTDYTAVDLGVQIGLARAWSLSVNAPVEYQQSQRPSGDTNRVEVEDLDLMLKYRFYMDNSGGIDTARAAVTFGTRLERVEGFSVDPHVGVVLTKVQGRNGINAEASYLLTTSGREETIREGDGTADLVRTNVSYVFRLWPAEFTSTSTGGWYATAELNGMWETNGDREVRWAPGLMYEGREVSFEVMMQLPVWHELGERAELDWSVGVGLRLLF